jgi:hypothetical protein
MSTVYAVGALQGAFLQEWWAMWSLALPIGVLLFIGLWDLVQPDTPVATNAYPPPALPRAQMGAAPRELSGSPARAA